MSEPTMSSAQPSMSAPDLVADGSRSVELADGLVILDANGEAMDAAARGDWAEAGLNLGLAGLDTLGVIFDPFAALLSSGLAWLMEHYEPLREPLDAVAGDPGRISAMAATWANVSDRLAETAKLYAGYVSRDLATFTGAALARYRPYAGREAELLRGLARSARATGESLQTAGAVVGAVRGVVVDLVSSAVAKGFSSVGKLVVSGGVATPWVVAEVTALVSRTMAAIADWMRRLVDAVAQLSRLLQLARGKLDELLDALRAVEQWGHETGVSKTAIFDDGLVFPSIRDSDFRQYGAHVLWTGVKHSATSGESMEDPLRQD